MKRLGKPTRRICSAHIAATKDHAGSRLASRGPGDGVRPHRGRAGPRARPRTRLTSSRSFGPVPASRPASSSNDPMNTHNPKHGSPRWSGHGVGASRNTAVLCCRCTTRVANTPTMATAITRRTSKNAFERAQKMHLTPPVRPPQTTRHTRKCNQICLNEVLSVQRGKLTHEPRYSKWAQRSYGEMRRPLSVVLPRPYVSG